MYPQIKLEDLFKEPIGHRDKHIGSGWWWLGNFERDGKKYSRYDYRGE